MKKITTIAVLGLMTLAACQKSPDPVAVDDTVTDQSVTITMGDAPRSLNEQDEATERAADEQAKKEADEAEADVRFMYLNAKASNRIFILQDQDTGCEFIQFDDKGLIPRPNGKGGQRGCGNGPDFKKP